MNPLFVIAAIRGFIRIGRTAADAYEQYAQEKPILLPDVESGGRDPVDYIRGVAADYPGFATLLREDPYLKKLWVDDSPSIEVPDAKSVVLAVAYRFDNEKRKGTQQTQAPDEILGGMMVGQWARGKGPVSPWARVIVTMADVALEYVGSNPGVLGVGGNGEKLIGALATAIGQAIPDGETRTTLGPKDRFAERLAALVLHSGLKVITEQPDLVFGEDHLQTLLKNTLPPLIGALPQDDVTAQVEWRELVDAMLGPAVSTAMATVAASPAAFLGRNFAKEKTLGVMVAGLFNAAKDKSVKDTISRQGLFALFQAAARVAAENPELVLGDLLGDKDIIDPNKRKAADDVALNLFKSISKVLAKHPPPYQDEIGAAIAVAVIDGFKMSGPALFNAQNPWDRVAGAVTERILNGFKEALGDKAQKLSTTVFSKERLVDLARVFVLQVAETPRMLVDKGEEDLQRIVAAVAKAIAQDEKLLLTADDWIKIAGVAAQEAALNPGRLFGINAKSANGMIAADIIGRLLKAASDDLVRADRTDVGPLMIGETLREAIIVTLRGLGGNLENASAQQAKIEDLARKLNDAAVPRRLSMGGKEWSRLFRALLPGVLTKGEIPVLDDASIALILSKA